VVKSEANDQKAEQLRKFERALEVRLQDVSIVVHMFIVYSHCSEGLVLYGEKKMDEEIKHIASNSFVDLLSISEPPIYILQALIRYTIHIHATFVRR
jgi:hypothetical protein